MRRTAISLEFLERYKLWQNYSAYALRYEGDIGILKEVHRQGILHKMINPLNIFVDPASGTVKLTGFGLAARLPKENLTTLSPLLTGETH